MLFALNDLYRFPFIFFFSRLRGGSIMNNLNINDVMEILSLLIHDSEPNQENASQERPTLIGWKKYKEA